MSSRSACRGYPRSFPAGAGCPTPLSCRRFTMAAHLTWMHCPIPWNRYTTQTADAIKPLQGLTKPLETRKEISTVALLTTKNMPESELDGEASRRTCHATQGRIPWQILGSANPPHGYVRVDIGATPWSIASLARRGPVAISSMESNPPPPIFQKDVIICIFRLIDMVHQTNNLYASIDLAWKEGRAASLYWCMAGIGERHILLNS